jgi:UDP-glucose 4-epimerase
VTLRYGNRTAAAAAEAAAFAPEFRPARAGEVLRSCLGVSRARDELGLAAPTDLTDGLRTTLDWVRTLPSALRTP